MRYPVEFTAEYPEKLSRLTTFFRFLTIIPHAFVLEFIGIAACVVLVIAWFAIMFTGRYPKSMFNFIVWYTRWYTRYTGYFSLLTDKYPPFNGDPSTPAGTPASPTAPPAPR